MMVALNTVWEEALSDCLQENTQSSWVTTLIDNPDARQEQAAQLATFWYCIGHAWQTNAGLTLPCFLQQLRLVLACPLLSSKVFPEQPQLGNTLVELDVELRAHAYKKISKLNAPQVTALEMLELPTASRISMQDYWSAVFKSLVLTLPGQFVHCPEGGAPDQEMYKEVEAAYSLLQRYYQHYKVVQLPANYDLGGEAMLIAEKMTRPDIAYYEMQKPYIEKLSEASRKFIQDALLDAYENQLKVLPYAEIYHTGIPLSDGLLEKINKRRGFLSRTLKSGMPYAQKVSNAYRRNYNMPERDRRMAKKERKVLEEIAYFEMKGVLTPRLFIQTLPSKGVMSYQFGSETYALLLAVYNELKAAFGLRLKQAKAIPGVKIQDEALIEQLEASRNILDPEVPQAAKETDTIDYPEDLFAGSRDEHQHSEACGQAQKYYIYNHLRTAQEKNSLSLQDLQKWRSDLCCHAWKWGQVKSPVPYGPLESWAVRLFEKVEADIIDSHWQKAGVENDKLYQRAT